MFSCETCDFCVYVGEGDFVCDRGDELELVIEGWCPVREPCEHAEVDDG